MRGGVSAAPWRPASASDPPSALLWIAGAAALAAGVLGVAVGWAYVALGAIAIVIVGAVVRRPAVGAALVIVLVTILPRTTLFERGVAFGGGTLKITDALVALTLVSWLAVALIYPQRTRLPSTASVLLVTCAIGLSVASVVTANSFETPLKFSLLELRPLLSYLLIFPIVSDVRNMREFELGAGIALVATGVASALAVAQYIQGEGLDATYAGGAVRVTGVPVLAPMIAVVMSLSLLVYARSPRMKAALAVLAVLGLGGLFVTFLRGAWIAVLLAMVFSLVAMPSRARPRLLAIGAIVASAAAALVVLANGLSASGVANPLESGRERLLSVGSFERDVSALHRQNEWSTALGEIADHPLTGIGLGSSITFYSPMYSIENESYGSTFTSFYIHSSVIWFPLKLGLLGAALYGLLVLSATVSGFRQSRRARLVRARPYFFAASLTLASMVLLSTNGPHLNVDSATPWAAALIGAIELLRRLDADQPVSASSEVGEDG